MQIKPITPVIPTHKVNRERYAEVQWFKETQERKLKEQEIEDTKRYLKERGITYNKLGQVP